MNLLDIEFNLESILLYVSFLSEKKPFVICQEQHFEFRFYCIKISQRRRDHII